MEQGPKVPATYERIPPGRQSHWTNNKNHHFTAPAAKYLLIAAIRLILLHKLFLPPIT